MLAGGSGTLVQQCRARTGARRTDEMPERRRRWLAEHQPLRCALSSRDVRWWLSPTALPPHPAGNTLVSFLLVLVNLERFETASHQIEYANELTMAGAESAARGGGCP